MRPARLRGPIGLRSSAMSRDRYGPFAGPLAATLWLVCGSLVHARAFDKGIFVKQSALPVLWIAMALTAPAASAQTIVNLSTLAPSGLASSGSATNLDLLNSATALSTGGLFPGAVTALQQSAVNRLNTLGVGADGAIAAVTFGTQGAPTGTAPAVEINTITSAYRGGGVDGATSATIGNLNAAVSGAVNPIIGAGGSLNQPWTGGYGAAGGSVLASGAQTGINVLNAVAARMADGSAVALSQLPGAPGSAAPAIAQGGALNLSTVNTALAYTTAGTATVAGGSNGQGQVAAQGFNSATLVGNGLSVAAQQLADGLNPTETSLQSVNRALAFSANNNAANVDPTVRDLGQVATVGLNTLAVSGTGSTTLSGAQSIAGSSGTPSPVVANQVAASTIGAGGFMPDASGAAWTGFAGTVAAGMPSPGSFTTVALLNQAGGTAQRGAGDVGVAAVTQTQTTSMNTVSATGGSLTFGPAGFGQVTGMVALATPIDPAGTGGVNNVRADTNVGRASLVAVGQGFGTSFNTLATSGDTTGTLSQNSAGVNYAGALLAAPDHAGQLALPTATPNAGSGIAEGIPANANAGPYAVHPNAALTAAGSPILGTPAWNTASAVTSYGQAAASGVAQNASGAMNTFSAGGRVDSGAAGTVAQQLDVLALSCACTSGSDAPMPQQISVTTLSAGNANATALAQSQSVAGNMVRGATGVSGSVAQSAMAGTMSGTTNAAFNPANAIAVSSLGQGSANLAAIAQANTVRVNSISSEGTLGSGASPAAFSQSTGGTGAAIGSKDAAAANTPAMVFALPWNNVSAAATSGAGGSAGMTGVVQSAGMRVNEIAGAELSGNSTQVANRQATVVTNNAMAYAAGSPAGTPAMMGPAVGTTGLEVYGVMSGSATLLATTQAAQQGFNTLAVAGALNGVVNQLQAGGALQTTGNQSLVQANRGRATTTGSQTAQNSANTVSAR